MSHALPLTSVVRAVVRFACVRLACVRLACVRLAAPLAALLATTVATPLAAQAADQPAAFARAWNPALRILLQELETHGVVGAGYAFLHGERILSQGSHGFADLAEKRRVDADTIFHWASITKTFTSVAAHQLVARKKIGLDDRIAAHIPSLRQVHAGEFDLDAVTIRRLLQHSGGFRANTFPWGNATWHPYEPAHWRQVEAMFPYTRLHFAPGSRFSYSNPGLVFVGRVIELVAGEDYEVYVDKNILKPLGMHRSFFDNTPYHLLRHRSNNYAFAGGAHRGNGLDLDTGVTVSNGGLNAPLPDMARYLRFLVGAGDAGDAARHRGVLDAATLRSMWQPAHDAGMQGTWKRSMATAFFVYEKDGRRVIGHTGSQRGFQCFFLADPEHGTAVLAAFNSASASKDPEFSTRQIMYRFMNRVLDDVLPAFGE